MTVECCLSTSSSEGSQNVAWEVLNLYEDDLGGHRNFGALCCTFICHMVNFVVTLAIISYISCSSPLKDFIQSSSSTLWVWWIGFYWKPSYHPYRVGCVGYNLWPSCEVIIRTTKKQGCLLPEKHVSQNTQCTMKAIGSTFRLHRHDKLFIYFIFFEMLTWFMPTTFVVAIGLSDYATVVFLSRVTL